MIVGAEEATAELSFIESLIDFDIPDAVAIGIGVAIIVLIIVISVLVGFIKEMKRK